MLSSNDVAKTLSNKKAAVSEISEIELLSFPKITATEEQIILRFLDVIEVIPMNKDIKEHTIHLRRKYKFKLPDAIICATALSYNLTLVTNDLALHKVSEISVMGLEQLPTFRS